MQTFNIIHPLDGRGAFLISQNDNKDYKIIATFERKTATSHVAFITDDKKTREHVISPIFSSEKELKTWVKNNGIKDLGEKFFVVNCALRKTQ
jgi:hypothetical protein